MCLETAPYHPFCSFLKRTFRSLPENTADDITVGEEIDLSALTDRTLEIYFCCSAVISAVFV